MTQAEKIQKIIHLIDQSELDQTIKNILIRDLQNEGRTDFLREQIKAYCLEGLRRIDEQSAEAKQVLEEDIKIRQGSRIFRCSRIIFMKRDSIKKYIGVSVLVSALAYVGSLIFFDTNSIINCSGKYISYHGIGNHHSLSEIAEKGRSLGYEVEHFPEDVTVAKKIETRYYQKFTLDSTANISLSYGSGYCKLRSSAIKKDVKQFLDEFAIDSKWINSDQIRVFDHRPLFDFLPHFSF